MKYVSKTFMVEIASRRRRNARRALARFRGCLALGEAAIGIWGQRLGNFLREKTQSSASMKLAVEELRARKARKGNGGRSRTRTYDLAHVRRAL